MDDELEGKLEKVMELVEENNKMLHKIRGVQRREAVWRTLKILIIAGITLGSLYFLEPYVNRLISTYNSIVGVSQQINDSPFKNLFK